MDQSINNVVRKYRSSLECLGVQVHKIILNGSQSDGTSNEHSDIDVIVVSDDFVGMDLWDRQCLLGDATDGILDPIEALRRE